MIRFQLPRPHSLITKKTWISLSRITIDRKWVQATLFNRILFSKCKWYHSYQWVNSWAMINWYIVEIATKRQRVRISLYGPTSLNWRTEVKSTSNLSPSYPIKICCFNFNLMKQLQWTFWKRIKETPVVSSGVITCSNYHQEQSISLI